MDGLANFGERCWIWRESARPWIRVRIGRKVKGHAERRPSHRVGARGRVNHRRVQPDAYVREMHGTLAVELEAREKTNCDEK